MRLVITPEESNRLDAAATEPVVALMERAGMAVSLAAVEMGISYGARVSVLAGKGNNGGDGYVAARYLARRGVTVTVHARGAPAAGTPAAAAAARAIAAGVTVEPLAAPVPADLVIDALFGVGFRGALPADVLPWIDGSAPVLAVDVPSGLAAGSGEVLGAAFTAARTVTFHALKPGHLLGEGPERCGRITVADIGLIGGEPELRLCEEPDAPLPVRPRTAHKWSVGSVAVIGGSPGMIGAAVLAGEAALATGAGSVAVVCPGGMQAQVAGLAPGLLTHGVGDGTRFGPDAVPAALEYADRFDVAVLGPGLGPSPDFVAGVVAGRAGKLLIDADGLNCLEGLGPLEARTAPTIITPHAAEFSRLTGEPASYRAAAVIPDKTGVVVLLKGNPTFVLGAENWVVTSGGPELATIGTGDVLAGMVAALWGRGLDGETAARSAAYWHGTAGSNLARHRVVTAVGLVYGVGSTLAAAG